MKKLTLKSVLEAGLVVLAVMTTAAEAQSAPSFLCDLQVKSPLNKILFTAQDVLVTPSLVSADEEDEVPGAEVMKDFTEKLTKTLMIPVRITAKFNGTQLVLGLGRFNKFQESKISLMSVASADPSNAPVKLMSPVPGDSRVVYSCRSI